MRSLLGDVDDFAELDRKLLELERDHEDDELYPDSFIAEFTVFGSWDEFKLQLAATARDRRDEFMTTATCFSCLEEMEGMALERLVARKAQTWR